MPLPIGSGAFPGASLDPSGIPGVLEPGSGSLPIGSGGALEPGSLARGEGVGPTGPMARLRRHHRTREKNLQICLLIF